MDDTQNAQAKLLLQKKAEELIQLMNDYHAGDSQSSRFETQKVQFALRCLEKDGLIAIRIQAKVGDYVLRNTVHGSPILIFVTPNFVFTSLTFAQCCQAILDKEDEDIQVLQIIS